MGRDEHSFQFGAAKIAAAAQEEAAYHRKRLAHWEDEYEQCAAIILETARIKIDRQPVTGGDRVIVAVDYGDPAAYERLQTAWRKMQWHRDAAERFESDADVYATQGDRSYELTTADVHYYRLGGGRREE